VSIRLPALPPQTLQKLAEVMRSPEKFVKMMKIHHKYKNRIVPFEPNQEQLHLLGALQEHNRIIVLKPRQIGVSTMLRAWAFYKTWVSQHPVKWGVVSYHQRSARHLHEMDKTFYNELPPPLRRFLSVNSASTIRFRDTNAEISSFTAGSKQGTRSFTLTSAHLSEFAFYAEPEEALATITATVGSGQIIIESTPNLPGDFFHRLVMGAQDGSNGWKLVNFWWHQHSHYTSPAPDDFEPSEAEEELAGAHGLTDDQLWWRRQQVNTLGESKFRREYPGCLDDAFHFAESVYFPGDVLDPIELLTFEGAEKLYEEPNDLDLYAIGVDVGAGVGQDYSTITVISATTFQVVYQWRSNMISPVSFGDKVAQVYERYNKARVLCESNNHGHVTLYRMRQLGVKNLWVRPDGKDWVTSTKSKLDAYETLREYIVGGIIQRLDVTTMMELRSLVVVKVCPEAASGAHDDMAMSMALAYRCLRDLPRRQILDIKRSGMEHRLSQRRAKNIRGQVIPWRRSS